VGSAGIMGPHETPHNVKARSARAAHGTGGGCWTGAEAASSWAAWRAGGNSSVRTRGGRSGAEGIAQAGWSGQETAGDSRRSAPAKKFHCGLPGEASDVVASANAASHGTRATRAERVAWATRADGSAWAMPVSAEKKAATKCIRRAHTHAAASASGSGGAKAEGEQSCP